MSAVLKPAGRVVSVLRADGWRAVYDAGPALPVSHFLVVQDDEGAVSHLPVVWKDAEWQLATAVGRMICLAEPGTSTEMAVRRAKPLLEG